MALLYVKPKGTEGQGEGFSPSTWQLTVQDVSAAESGRTEDTIMHKNRVGQKRKIEISFVGTQKAETGRILRAFNPEYIDVYYEDDMDVRWEWRTFYCGDRPVSRKCWWNGNQIHDSVSVSLIEV